MKKKNKKMTKKSKMKKKSKMTKKSKSNYLNILFFIFLR